jgi:hypothetical protein
LFCWYWWNCWSSLFKLSFHNYKSNWEWAVNIIIKSFSFLFTIIFLLIYLMGASWPWSYGSWIYNYLCNQCLSPLMLWVWISIRAKCITLCDKVCQWLATGQWFSPGTPVSSTNKTFSHDITEILLKVMLNTIRPNTLTQLPLNILVFH